MTPYDHFDEEHPYPLPPKRDRVIADSERIEALQAENAQLREALVPFSIFAGCVFSQNYNNDDVVATFQGKYGRVDLLAGPFFDARAALSAPDPAPDEPDMTRPGNDIYET